MQNPNNGASANLNTQNNTKQAPAKRKKKKPNIFLRILIIFFKFIAVCFCLGVITFSTIAVLLSLYIVETTAGDDTLLDLENLKLAYTSFIYYKDVNEQGQEEWVLYQSLDSPEENRVWVDWHNIDDTLKNAFVAIEDDTFWEHEGINIRRTIYAILNEVSYSLTGSYLRGDKQGASTITQQLIKNITDDTEDEGTAGYLRKIREIFRALALSNRYSRDTIFEAYLNTISLTGNIGGVQAGANRYFNKYVGTDDCIANGVEPLTIAEAATIACITKNQTAYSPITNPEQHLVRRNQVIYNMYVHGYISEAEYEDALNEPLTIFEELVDENAATQSNNSYFTDTLINEVVEDYMEQKGVTQDEAYNWLYSGGVRIYSTLVPSLQTTMEDVFFRGEHWPAYEQVYEPDGYVPEPTEDGSEPEPNIIRTQAAGAFVNYEGELAAIVGGLGAKTADRILNRGADMERAIGSTIKGITVYPLAIEYDIAHYSSTRIDTPYTTESVNADNRPVGWPSNYEPGYTYGANTVYDAFRDSRNTIAVWLGSDVGVNEMFTFLNTTLEIDSLVDPDDRNLAPMALGSFSTGMSPYDLAAAYIMDGNGGQFYSPHSYTSVEDVYNNVVLTPDINRVQAISEDTSYIMSRLLRDVMVTGTGAGMSADDAGMESIGKTGTTNENKDIWFVGMTPYYSGAFWFGYDENVSMSRYYIAGASRHPGIKAWREIMDTEQADDIVTMRFCQSSGAAAGAACPSAVGYYKKDTILGTCVINHAAPAA